MVWGRINTKVDKFNSSKIILAEYAGFVPEGHKAVFKDLEKYAKLVLEIVATENGGTQYVLHLPGGDPESSLIFDLNNAFARVKRELDSAQSATGGIDMNTSKMGMNVTGEKINIQLDNAMIDSFKRGDFTGVRPVILNVTPIQSVLPLLGLAPRREDDELAKG